MEVYTPRRRARECYHLGATFMLLCACSMLLNIMLGVKLLDARRERDTCRLEAK